MLSTGWLAVVCCFCCPFLCAVIGKQLYIAEVVGPLAYAFVNLGHHTYTDKTVPGQEPVAEPAVKEIHYARLEEALARPVSQCLGRRPIHPLYQVGSSNSARAVHGA